MPARYSLKGIAIGQTGPPVPLAFVNIKIRAIGEDRNAKYGDG